MHKTLACLLAASLSLHAVVTRAQTAPTHAVADHVAEVRHLGLHYFGAADLGAAPSTGSSGTALDPLTVYTLGVRYWFNPRVGIEAGVGFGYAASSTVQSQGGTPTSTSSPARGSLGATLGVPIALAWSHSLVLALVPFASYAGSFQPNGTSMGGYDNTAVVRVGVQLEAAVHLGFLGLPQVALEARFGVQAQVALETTLNRISDTAYQYTQTVNYGVGTTLGEFSLEHVLTSSLAATYYF